MKHVALTAFLGVGLLAFACGGDDDTSSSSNTTSPTGPTTTTSASGGNGVGGNGSTTTTTSANGGAGQGGSGTGGAVDPCMPDPGDTACATCTKGMCCTQLQACYANPDCACLVDCLNANGGQVALQMCLGVCNLTVSTIPAEALALGNCVNSMCAMACGTGGN